MKTLFFLLLIVIPMGMFAQDPKFKGVGELRVRETTLSFIDSVLTKTKKKIKKVQRYAPADDQANQKFVVEYTKPDDKCFSTNNPIIPQHKIYVLYNYALLDQYVCPKVLLDFYNDTLYHFIITEPVFMADFKTKHGEPVIDEILHQSSCTLATEPMKYEDKDIIENWDDQYMHAAYVLNTTRSADCEKQISTQFEVKDMETDKIVQQLEHEEFKRCQESDPAVKRISERF